MFWKRQSYITGTRRTDDVTWKIIFPNTGITPPTSNRTWNQNNNKCDLKQLVQLLSNS